MTASALSAWLRLTLWIGGALWLARAGVLYVMDFVMRDQDRPLTLWRIAVEVPQQLAFAFVIGAVVSGIALGLGRLSAERGSRVVSRSVAIFVCGALVLSVLSGWPIDDPYHVPDISEPRGQKALQALAVCALAFSAALLVAGAIVARTPVTSITRTALTIGGLTFSVAFPLTYWQLYGSVSAYRNVREVVRELLFEEPAWTVTTHHPDKRPFFGAITPHFNSKTDGGDMPTLVMPPPCEVEFVVGEDDGEVVLRTAAGVDVLVGREAGETPLAFRFEIHVNDERVFDETIEVYEEQPFEECFWHHAGGEAGIALKPGDCVRLATTMSGDTTKVHPVGFGRLELEREVKRGRAQSSPEAPNIVLIVMDTLRRDRMSLHGYEHPLTPNLDRLAGRGTVFDDGYATSSWTWPSTASVLTGLHPDQHGVVGDGSCWLNGSLETLPEVLEKRGYTTAAFSCNPLIVPEKNFDQGFESFDSALSFRKSDIVVPSITQWLERHTDIRFFLYLHLVDPHATYKQRPESLALVGGKPPANYPPDGLLAWKSRLNDGAGHDESGNIATEQLVSPEYQDWLQRSYDAAVNTSDHYVGLVLDQLDALGLAEETIVAFTTDHGEELLDHGLVAHGHTLFPELVRAPIILAGPGIAAGERVAGPISNRHLAPTLARFGGARLESVTDAVDLVASDLAPAPVFFSTENGWWNGRYRQTLRGVLDGDWVLHFAPAGTPWGKRPGQVEQVGQIRLYDRAQDPELDRDVASEHPDVAARLKALLDDHAAKALEHRPVRTFGAGESTIDLLQGIGYIGGEEDE